MSLVFGGDDASRVCGICTAGLLVTLRLSRFSSFCGQAKMLGISAGMFQKDSYLLWLMHGWFAGYVAPRAVSLTACRLWLSAVAHPVPIVICRPGLAALLWRAHRSSGTRLDLWCFDLGLRYQRWRRLLEGIDSWGISWG